jgi:hypothetical protein
MPTQANCGAVLGESALMCSGAEDTTGRGARGVLLQPKRSALAEFYPYWITSMVRRRKVAVMERPFAMAAALLISSFSPVKAIAACDELVGRLISTKLRPLVEVLDCAVVKGAGVDRKDHKLVGVCSESTGPISQIKIDTQLHCHSSDESVAGKLLGGKNAPSVSENLTVEAEATESDCHVTAVWVKPSGELGKALAALFDANGKARAALQEGFTQACGK